MFVSLLECPEFLSLLLQLLTIVQHVHLIFVFCLFVFLKFVVSFRGCTQFRLDSFVKRTTEIELQSSPFNLKIYILPPFPSFSSEKYHIIAKKTVIVCVKGRANTYFFLNHL